MVIYHLHQLRFYSQFQIKTKGIYSWGQSDEEDEDDDPTKINMTQKYRFNEEDTVLFPVRPFRDDGITRAENEIAMPDVESNKSQMIARQEVHQCLFH